MTPFIRDQLSVDCRQKPAPPKETQTLLYDNEQYTAYTEDLEFMWRWAIYRDKKLVQEGCSLSFNASKEAVKHVLAFFNLSKRKD